jgi:hypothetical protein
VQLSVTNLIAIGNGVRLCSANAAQGYDTGKRAAPHPRQCDEMHLFIDIERVDETRELCSGRIIGKLHENGAGIILRIPCIRRLIPCSHFGIVFTSLDDDVGYFFWCNIEHGERSYGAFERALQLQETIDYAKVEATFHNGVLKVTAPKRPEALKVDPKVEIKWAA